MKRKILLFNLMLASLIGIAGCNDNSSSSINNDNTDDTTDNQFDSNGSESTSKNDSSLSESFNELHFSTEWLFDQFEHWHGCVDEGLEKVKKDKEKHNLVDGKCTICDYRIETYQGYTFQLERKIDLELLSYSLVDVDEDIINAIIPSYYNALPVERVSGCFKDHVNLVSVTIPNTVRFISKYATGTFSGCSSLKSVYIPDSVHYIGENTFEGCTSLESVRLPNRLDSIRYNTFYGCSSLKEINIPESVTEIGDYAFYGCSNLINVSIPNSIVSLGNEVFSKCDSLNFTSYKNGLYLGNQNNKYVLLYSIENENCSSFETNIQTRIISNNVSNSIKNISSIIFNNFIKEIPQGMFSNCQS
ncbi:MAG TPA: hypothetical protein DDW20_04325, partial [Firmicutes bacterium]|nr:hypothetical protein [Bacillota bacterium]